MRSVASKTATTSTAPKGYRRWFRFSLRALFVMVTLAALCSPLILKLAAELYAAWGDLSVDLRGTDGQVFTITGCNFGPPQPDASTLQTVDAICTTLPLSGLGPASAGGLLTGTGPMVAYGAMQWKYSQRFEVPRKYLYKQFGVSDFEEPSLLGD